ncbi:MAG: ThuA domain-containing protein, partial [Bacteroidota bacterium]|nr:ThuA domain-containing protein [Bacteroidota bacterium]
CTRHWRSGSINEITSGMMFFRSMLVVLISITTVNAQSVLHFTKTSGFDHGTREVSFNMFTSLADELLIEVDDDSDGTTFNELGTLMEYEVIIFSNTSGNAILNTAQRSNFENWIAAGGDVFGIHAASDTYRHSTANGSGTGEWDFYSELIGASVQASPNHVSGTPAYALHKIGAHPSTAALPDPWIKEEEYYYWENGYLNAANQPVLEVEETMGPNGEVNSYDAPRPMSWYRITGSGRVFYTALGHAQTNYTSDDLFRLHIKNALVWLLDGGNSLDEIQASGLTHFYSPSEQILKVVVPYENSGNLISITDLTGRVIHQEKMRAGLSSINTAGWRIGVYYISSAIPARGSACFIW